MKILCCIPVVFGSEVLEECLNQLINIPNVDILVCLNGAEPAVKKVCDEFRTRHGVKIWTNKVNAYVNSVWNDFIEYFINSDYDYLCLCNSDITLNINWSDILKSRWFKNPQEIILPKVIDDKTLMYKSVRMCADKVGYPTGGVPGIFITLTQEQASAVYPIEPKDMLVWFGDNFLFSVLLGLGYKIAVPDNFLCYHHHSYTTQRVEGISEIIENDKIIWETVGKHKVQERIKKLKQQL